MGLNGRGHQPAPTLHKVRSIRPATSARSRRRPPPEIAGGAIRGQHANSQPSPGGNWSQAVSVAAAGSSTPLLDPPPPPPPPPGCCRRFFADVRAGQLEEVQGAIKAQPDLLLQSTTGSAQSALHIAAAGGHTDLLAALLARARDLGHALAAKGAAAAAASPRARAPAAPRSGEQWVRRLVDARNNSRQTPLMLAAAAGHGRCVELLLEHVSVRPPTRADLPGRPAFPCSLPPPPGRASCTAAASFCGCVHTRQHCWHPSMHAVPPPDPRPPACRLDCRALTPGFSTAWAGAWRCTTPPATAAPTSSTPWWRRRATAGPRSSPTRWTPSESGRRSAPA